MNISTSRLAVVVGFFIGVLLLASVTPPPKVDSQPVVYTERVLPLSLREKGLWPNE